MESTTGQQTTEFNINNTTSVSEDVDNVKKASFMEIMKQFSKECFAGSIAGSSGLIVGHPLGMLQLIINWEKLI